MPIAERLRDAAYNDRTTETAQIVAALDKHLPKQKEEARAAA